MIKFITVHHTFSLDSIYWNFWNLQIVYQIQNKVNEVKISKQVSKSKVNFEESEDRVEKRGDKWVAINNTIGVLDTFNTKEEAIRFREEMTRLYYNLPNIN